MARTANFGDLPEEYSTLKKSEVVILPVPYDATSTWIKGADKGPTAIIEASTHMELYDIETDSQVFTGPGPAHLKEPEKLEGGEFEMGFNGEDNPVILEHGFLRLQGLGHPLEILRGQ